MRFCFQLLRCLIMQQQKKTIEKHQIHEQNVFLTLSVLSIHLFLDVDCRFLISMSQKKFNKFTFLGLFAELLTSIVEIGNFLRPFQHQSMCKTQSSGSESFFLCKKTVPALSNSWSTASD